MCEGEATCRPGNNDITWNSVPYLDVWNNDLDDEIMPVIEEELLLTDGQQDRHQRDVRLKDMETWRQRQTHKQKHTDRQSNVYVSGKVSHSSRFVQDRMLLWYKNSCCAAQNVVVNKHTLWLPMHRSFKTPYKVKFVNCDSFCIVANTTVHNSWIVV